MREARVRPEFASLYPGLRPGEWDAAATVADRVLAGWLMRGSETVIRGRALLDTHFEFRGKPFNPSAGHARAALSRVSTGP